MNPELIAAIKERLVLGRTEAEVREEMRAAGYGDDTITALYLSASTRHDDVLPSVTALIRESVAFVRSHPDLWAWLFLAYFLGTISEFLSVAANLPGATIALIGSVFSVVSLLLIFFATTAITYAASHQESRASFGDGAAWLAKNFFSYLWVVVVTFWATIAGFFFLLVPGIIIIGYLAFAQFTVMREGLRGFDALARSHQLVRGRWLALFWRLLALAGVTFLVMILYIFVVALAIFMFGETPQSLELTAFFVTAAVTSALTTFSIAGAGHLYLHRVRQAPAYDRASSRAVRRVYIVVAASVPVLIVLVLVLLLQSL